MALFSLGKKKKEGGGSLANYITNMRQQGYSDDQIIQILQNQGHKSSEIYDAISKADIGGGATGVPFSDQFPQDSVASPGQYAYDQSPEAQPSPPPEPMQSQQMVDDKERIEQIAEAIIDEKWNDLIKDINKIMELNKETESKLTKMEVEIKNLRENFDSLHKGVLGKITEYDQNLVNVGTEIKAMEKVFQKILPTFTENINKLSRLTEGSKISGKKK